MKRLGLAIVICIYCLGFGVGQGYATPVLQLYIEGAVYDSATETWTLRPEGSTINLWAIGNVSGPGGKGTVAGVKLAITYAAEAYDENPLGITLTPSTTGYYGGFTDESVSSNPTLNPLVKTSKGLFDTTNTGGVVTNGGSPLLNDGRPLPSHGETGQEYVWMEFLLGDFDQTDSPIADFIAEEGYDFINTFPDSGDGGFHENSGQINVYEINVNGGGGTIHFDLYNSVMSGTKGKYAPFSHDAEITPEPASFVVWSLLGLLAIGLARFRRRR